MSKTLKTIQTLSKIAKIISKIVFICCIVGASCCLAGIITLAVIPEGMQVGGVTFRAYVEQEASVSIGTVYASMAVAMIMCLGEIFLAKFAENYFKHELEAGTPFTFDGAKELLHLGIKTIWIPIVTVVVASITHGILSLVFENVDKFEGSNFVSITLGITFIIGSLLCKHGAEVSVKEENQE